MVPMYVIMYLYIYIYIYIYMYTVRVCVYVYIYIYISTWPPAERGGGFRGECGFSCTSSVGLREVMFFARPRFIGRRSPSPTDIIHPPKSTANLRTQILDFRGFDSNIILILRAGILMSIGNKYPGNYESTNLSRDNISREIGRPAAWWMRAPAAPQLAHKAGCPQRLHSHDCRLLPPPNVSRRLSSQ